MGHASRGSLEVLGRLLFGAGLSCVTVWGEHLFWVGILVGVAGVLGAYPLYTYITKKERERLAPGIIKLADALLQ